MAIGRKKTAAKKTPARKKKSSDSLTERTRRINECRECKSVTGHELSCSQHPDNRGVRPEPRIDPDDVVALQRQHDAGDFSGGVQQKDYCKFNDGECKHVAVLSKTVTTTCPTCEKSGKQKVDSFCLLHAIIVWGGGAPSRKQTEIFA